MYTLSAAAPSLLAARPASIFSVFAHSKPLRPSVDKQYSAGGIILNEENKIAVISKKSRKGQIVWCLPKGHIEKGETSEETAIREVREETGISGRILGSLATIDYWFTSNSQKIHKLVHHYVLRQISGVLNVAGDPDKEAQDAMWADLEDLPVLLSYPNERKIVKVYKKKYCQKR